MERLSGKDILTKAVRIRLPYLSIQVSKDGMLKYGILFVTFGSIMVNEKNFSKY